MPDQARDERLVPLSGWGGTAPTVAAHRFVEPSEVANAVKNAGPRGLIARGLGRSYGDAAQNAGGDVLEFGHSIDHIALDRETVSVTASAGVSLDALMRELVPHGYFVPVTPGTRFVSVGGAIAADIHGKNHHRHGSFGNHVRWLELVDGTGSPRRLDPHQTPDDFWATVGGMGLTGVITRASISLVEIETTRMRVTTERAANLDEAMASMAASDASTTYSVAWIDLLATGAALGRSVLTRGEHATVAEVAGSSRDTLAFSPQPRLVAPPMPSGLAVNPLSIRVFNELWFRKSPRRSREHLSSISAFFHPLDGVRDWNRLYGSRGFVQYQFVVPLGADGALRESVAMIAGARQASFLAVLKRFGSANASPLSFPVEGWTLALDLPVTSGLASLLDQLDQLVCSAGGRVYLAKDSRATADTIEAMYPRLAEFRAARDRLDPERVFTSDLARRLHL